MYVIYALSDIILRSYLKIIDYIFYVQYIAIANNYKLHLVTYLLNGFSVAM